MIEYLAGAAALGFAGAAVGGWIAAYRARGDARDELEARRRGEAAAAVETRLADADRATLRDQLAGVTAQRDQARVDQATAEAQRDNALGRLSELYAALRRGDPVDPGEQLDRLLETAGAHVPGASAAGTDPGPGADRPVPAPAGTAPRDAGPRPVRPR